MMTPPAGKGADGPNVFGTSFIRLLIEDVLAAQARRQGFDTSAHRREVIRAIFVAIEGAIWIYREDVRTAAQTMEVLTPVADLALRDRTFSVTDRGEILEQVRYLTLATSLQLLTRQAQLSHPRSFSIAPVLAGRRCAAVSTFVTVSRIPKA